MPILSVNMAQPSKPCVRESQIYILPTEYDDGPEDETVNNIRKKKYVIIKMIEFVSISVSCFYLFFCIFLIAIFYSL